MAGSKTPAESTSTETPSGQRRANPASVAGMPNPFDFSAMTGLLNVCEFSLFSWASLSLRNVFYGGEFVACRSSHPC